MKKTCRNLVLASAIAAVTVSCGGAQEGSEYTPDIRIGDISANGDSKDLLFQELAYMFGDIFKQLIGTLDVSSANTASFTDSQSTLGRLVNEALSQQTPDTASGISLGTSAPCSKEGEFFLGVHFLEGGQDVTPDANFDAFTSFSENEIETGVRADFRNCVEQGRNAGVVVNPDASNKDDRLDPNSDTTINGIMDISFVSFPKDNTGFSLVADIKMDDFAMVTSGDSNLDPKGTIRFDGQFSISLRTDDAKSDPNNVEFVANIGANYVNTFSDEFSKISIDASGRLNTNANFNAYSYDLDFRGSTTNHKVSTKTFEYFATQNIKKNTFSGGLTPEEGELMIITPDGDAGTATITNDAGTINVQINFGGDSVTCTFADLLAGSDRCSN